MKNFKDILRKMINIKYLFMELLIFFGAIITVVAVTSYFTSNVLVPFLSNLSDITSSIFSLLFIIFWGFMMISFMSWIHGKIIFFSRDIRSIFRK